MKLEKNPLCSHNSNECKSPFISCSSTPVERSFTCCWWAYDLTSLESKLLTASEFEASTQHCDHARLASERSLEHYLDWNIFFPKIISFCLGISSWGESKHHIQNMTQPWKRTEVDTSTPSATGSMLQYFYQLFIWFTTTYYWFYIVTVESGMFPKGSCFEDLVPSFWPCFEGHGAGAWLPEQLTRGGL